MGTFSLQILRILQKFVVRYVPPPPLMWLTNRWSELQIGNATQNKLFLLICMPNKEGGNKAMSGLHLHKVVQPSSEKPRAGVVVDQAWDGALMVTRREYGLAASLN